MHILKTQQPSFTIPHKETSGSLWHNWVDNSGLYIFYTLVIFPSLYAGYFKFQNWPEDFTWIYGAFWSHWVTMGNIAPDVHSQIMLHDAFCRRLLLFIKRIFVSFNSRRGHIWTFAHNYWGLSFGELSYFKFIFKTDLQLIKHTLLHTFHGLPICNQLDFLQ